MQDLQRRHLRDRRRRPGVVLLLVCLLAGLPPAHSLAQQDRPVFRTRVGVTRIKVAVIDEAGDPVPGLGIEDFQVMEDGAPQELMLALDPVRYSLDVALVLDFSNSIRRDWSGEAARQAAHEFLDALGPDDCVYLVPFHHRVGPGVWGSPESHEIRTTIGSYPFDAQTRLYDAMLTAHDALDRRRPDSASAAAEELDDMMGSMWMEPVRSSSCGEALSLDEAADRRAAMVVLTDGEDLGSRSSYSDVLVASMRAEIPVFAVAVGNAAQAPRYRGGNWGIVRSATPQQRALSREAWENLRMLQEQLRELARVSGGQVVVQQDLRDGYADTLGLLRGYYVLAYETPEPFVEGWHELEVEVPGDDTHEIVVQPGIYRSDEDYVAAVESLRQASVQFELGDYEGALAQLDFVAQTSPDIGSPFFGRGLVLERMGQWEQARDSYHRSLRLNPGAPATHSRLAEVQFELGDYGAAWEHAMRAHRGGVNMNELFARLEPVAPPPDDIQTIMAGPRVHLLKPRVPEFEVQFALREVLRSLTAAFDGERRIALTPGRATSDFVISFWVRDVSDEPPRRLRARLMVQSRAGKVHQEPFEIRDIDETATIEEVVEAAFDDVREWILAEHDRD